MIKEQTVIEQTGFLNLLDLLTDETTEPINKYLSISIESFGENMKLNFTTIDEVPTTYTSTIIGAPYTDLQDLLEENLEM